MLLLRKRRRLVVSLGLLLVTLLLFLYLRFLLLYLIRLFLYFFILIILLLLLPFLCPLLYCVLLDFLVCSRRGSRRGSRWGSRGGSSSRLFLTCNRQIFKLRSVSCRLGYDGMCGLGADYSGDGRSIVDFNNDIDGLYEVFSDRDSHDIPLVKMLMGQWLSGSNRSEQYSAERHDVRLLHLMRCDLRRSRVCSILSNRLAICWSDVVVCRHSASECNLLEINVSENMVVLVVLMKPQKEGQRIRDGAIKGRLKEWIACR